MTGYGHLTVGAVVTVATLQVLEFELSAEFAIAAVVGIVAALLPDIDGAQSLFKSLVRGKDQPRIVQTFFGRMPRKRSLFKAFYVTLGATEVMIRAIAVKILNVLDWLLPHRGPTHYLITALIFDFCIYQATLYFGLSNIYAVAFTAGYISHILADSMTIRGVPLFGPVFKRSLHILPKPMRIRTTRGMSASERLWITLIICGAVGAVYFL